MKRCIALLAKNPEAGQVKTRLQPCCSPEDAAALYAAFLRDSAELLAAARADEKIVAYAPRAGREALQQLLKDCGDFTYVAQADGDLGARLQAVVQGAVARGAECVVVIGSDSPSLPCEYLDRAFELLEAHQVVLGPSTDGGYYLIGLQRTARCPFSHIAWSSGAVLEQTLQQIGGQSLGLLPPWYDVDTPTEAAFLRIHLRALHRAGSASGRHSLTALEGIELPPPS